MRLIQLRNELNKMKMGYARPDTQFENELCAPAKFKRDFIKSTVSNLRSCVGLHKCFVKGMLWPATMQQYSYPKHEIWVEPTDFDFENGFFYSKFRLRVFSSLYGCMGSLCPFIKDLFQRALRHNWLSQCSIEFHFVSVLAQLAFHLSFLYRTLRYVFLIDIYQITRPNEW